MPKGVDVKHGTMTNALLLEPGKLRIAAGSKIAQVLSISFAMGEFADYRVTFLVLTYHVGAWEMLGSMINGGTLYLRTSDWDATLAQVSLESVTAWHINLIRYSGRHSYLHTIDSVEISAAGLPKH